MSFDEFQLQGSCLCRACSFTVPTQAIRFGFASCHCSVCRLSHGAPFVLWSGVHVDQTNKFIMSCPEDGVKGYQSSEACTRFFCKDCGTHFYIKYSDETTDRWAGEVHFPTALLNPSSIEALEKVCILLFYSFLHPPTHNR